jgi:integrase
LSKLTIKQLQALKTGDVSSTIRDDGGLWGKVRETRDGISVTFWYRYRWEAKTRDTACGTWPSLSLPAIRAARDKARAQVGQGIDPNERRNTDKLERREAEAARAAALEEKLGRMTVQQLFERWMKLDLKNRKDRGAETERGFKKDVLPTLGTRYADSIKRSDIMTVLDLMMARGVNRLANRIFTELRQMFNFALVREIVLSNPTIGIEKKNVGGADVERDRVLTMDEIRALPAALDAADLIASTKHAVWLILATNARVGEVIKAHKSDIDLEAATWRIPPSNSKNEDAHIVFLSPFALTHMRALIELSNSDVWLMPARSEDSETHIDTKSITKQIADRQLKFYDRAAHSKRTTHKDALVLGDEKWTPHDLRRTAATLMQALGVLPAVIEACLNHREENRVKRVYLRHDYADEKRLAWLRLGERLDLLLTPGENVIVANFPKSA